MNGPEVVALLLVFGLVILAADLAIGIFVGKCINWSQPMQWDETDSFKQMEAALCDQPSDPWVMYDFRRHTDQALKLGNDEPR